MKETYYIKVGKRYKPVREYDSQLMDSFPEGCHLVVSFPGTTSYLYNIKPDMAALEAAFRVAVETGKITDEIRKVCEARPKHPWGKKQQEAFKKFQEESGLDMVYLDYPSIMDIVEAMRRAVCG